jgi:type IV secretory pathway VirB10-like protein
MATNTSAFFVGVGTTFAILALGFGGGLIMAKTAMEPPVERQARAADREPPTPVRVILPASAEPAQPPQPSSDTIKERALPVSPAPPIKETSVPDKSAEKVDTRKAEAEERGYRKRYAERKARRAAERAKRRQEIEVARPRDAPIVAFGSDEPRQGSGFFGN